MTKHISLLRGINVGAQKKILMKDLKALYESIGLKNVVTYIQSGNVVFESERSAAELAVQIREAIQQHYGFEVSVFLRGHQDFKQMVANNPFMTRPDYQPDRLYFTILDTEPSPQDLEKLTPFIAENEQLLYANGVVYLHVPAYGRTKLSNNLVENKLKLRATTRNLKTMLELIQLSEN